MKEQIYDEDKPLCKTEIQRNIINVDTGQPLTRSLKVLNQNCKFRSHWNKFCLKVYGDADKKAYYQKPEVKAYKKAYYQKPEVKAYMKAYYQKPEIKAYKKAYMKAYYRRPEVKAYMKAYMKAYYRRPEVKAYMKAYMKAYGKAYYQRNRKLILNKLHKKRKA